MSPVIGEYQSSGFSRNRQPWEPGFEAEAQKFALPRRNPNWDLHQLLFPFRIKPGNVVLLVYGDKKLVEIKNYPLSSNHHSLEKIFDFGRMNERQSWQLDKQIKQYLIG